MRTTVDIPDSMYREIKVQAASEGLTVREVILEGIRTRLARGPAEPSKPFQVPVIRSKRPGTLHLTNEQIDELTAFS